MAHNIALEVSQTENQPRVDFPQKERIIAAIGRLAYGDLKIYF
jgi:hypothetical protein